MPKNNNIIQATHNSTIPFWDTLKPVVVLVTICALAGLLLGLVYTLTAPVAQAAAEAREQATYEALMPDAATFEPMATNTEGCSAFLRAADDTGTTVGFIAKAEGKGYSGAVPLAISFTEDGTTLGVIVLQNDETPGLGTRIAEDDFIGQFEGLPAVQLEAGSIDTISGATISSNAARGAFNNAVTAFAEHQSQSGSAEMN